MTEKDFDKLLNIHTMGRDDSHSDAYRFPYEPTPYSVLERLSYSGLLTKQNTLLDYGCGKGRVSLFLSYQTRCTSIGIEYDERIYETALRNQEEAVSGKRVTFLRQDAVNYEIPPEVDRVFFFNPFSVEILQSVLGNVLTSYYACPREILLMFYFPSDEYIGALMTNDALEFEDEISCEDLFDENADRERIIIFRVSEI